MKQDVIKWQSKIFPRLILTEEHYQVMRGIYRRVESFQREMERLEAWLYANPGRVPKRNWKNQINSWMRIADEIAGRERNRRQTLGSERPKSHLESAESIGEIFKRFAEEATNSKKDGIPFDQDGRLIQKKDEEKAR